VAVDEFPPVTAVGFRLRLPIVPAPGGGGFSVKVAEALFAEVAVMEAEVVLATTLVETVNVPLLWPAAISILAGTVADPLSEDSVTDTPPAPAGDVSVTVPVEGDPPVTEVGFKLRLPIVPEPGAGGFRVRVAETLFAEVAVMEADVELATTLVDTVNVPLL
jgi:hypothetical protein